MNSKQHYLWLVVRSWLSGVIFVELVLLTKVVVCVHCGGEDVIRRGKTRNGKQRLKCKGCGRSSREDRQGPRYSEADKETILRAYLERPSMRGIQRVFGVSRQTLRVWLKKDKRLNTNQHPQRALAATLLAAQDDDMLELDELWSFVGSKKNRVWIWVVLCRRTRQVVACMWGDRSADTCKMLWDKVPEEYKVAFCYSDLLEGYQKVLDEKQHQAQSWTRSSGHMWGMPPAHFLSAVLRRSRLRLQLFCEKVWPNGERSVLRMTTC